VGVGAAPNEPIVEALLVGLEDSRCLLMLDNCEHLVGVSAELVDAVLRACPDVRVLATSREPLGVAGEVRWRVPPLAVPPGEALPPERVRAYPAVALFVERAASVAPGFHLTEENTAAVAGVCRRLDGIPLAIELAAARVGALSVEQLARRLDDRFRLLTNGSRTAPLRQQTLRASLDWSYELLSEPERVLLRRLAVFAGGFCLGAAETICVGDGLAVADVLGVLTQLVQKSLVQADHVDATGQYRLLETVRHYAWERLAEAGEEARVRDRHAACFARLTAEAGPPHGPGRSRWLDRLDREHDDLEATLRWAHVCGDVETSRRLVAALAELLVEPWPFLDERLGTRLSPHCVQITDPVPRSALTQAVEWGHAARGAAPLVEIPRVASGGTRPLSLAVPERHSHEPPFAALLTAGRRIGKALALRWQAVDLGAGWLAVRHTLENLPAHPRRSAEADMVEESTEGVTITPPVERSRQDSPLTSSP
jgi:predicted ATPase